MLVQAIRREWNTLGGCPLPFMASFRESISRAEMRLPDALPSLRGKGTFMIASDYSGEHSIKDAPYSCLSFLAFNDLHTWEWKVRRDRWRAPLGNRTMSYKGLTDNVKAWALAEFLEIADYLPGFSLSVLVDRKCEPFCIGEDEKESAQSFFGGHTSVSERCMQILHCLHLLIGGLAGPHQEILWLTDDGPIANSERLQSVMRLLHTMNDLWLPFNAHSPKVHTVKPGSGDLISEDLCSIPDFAAGALCETALQLRLEKLLPLAPEGTIRLPETVSPKALPILNWLSNNASPMRKLVYLIERHVPTGKLALSRVSLPEVPRAVAVPADIRYGEHFHCVVDDRWLGTVLSTAMTPPKLS